MFVSVSSWLSLPTVGWDRRASPSYTIYSVTVSALQPALCASPSQHTAFLPQFSLSVKPHLILVGLVRTVNTGKALRKMLHFVSVQ